MIHLVVTMMIKEGSMEEFMEAARELRHQVRREPGCHGYEYTVDLQSPLDIQEPVQENRVTLIEKWESLEALQAHLATPHMKAASPRMEALREGIAIRVTRSI